MYMLRRTNARGRAAQVFTIRRIIGESVLDRNEGLWREVDALEDILREAQVAIREAPVAIIQYNSSSVVVMSCSASKLQPVVCVLALKTEGYTAAAVPQH